MRALLPLALALAGCTDPKAGPGDGASASPTDSGRDRGDSGSPAPVPPLAAGVVIERAVLAQNSGVLLAAGGAAVTTRTAPVVADREGTLLLTLSAAAPRRVQLVAERIDPDDQVSTAAAQELDLGASLTAELALPAAAFTPGSALAISVLEVDNTERDGALDGARVPAAGWLDLDARAMPPLEVVLVPLELDGVGPALDAAALATYEAALRGWYPTATVRLSVHPSPLARDAGLASIEDLADEVFALGQRRLDDGAADHVVYYGVYDARSTAGLAGSSDFSVELRAAAGPGGGDATAARIMAHELGHLMGAFHAPSCRAGSPDPDFPTDDGTTGIETRDPVDGRWLPATTPDLMGYCDAVAVSPHTSAQLARGLQHWEADR